MFMKLCVLVASARVCVLCYAHLLRVRPVNLFVLFALHHHAAQLSGPPGRPSVADVRYHGCTCAIGFCVWLVSVVCVEL